MILRIKGSPINARFRIAFGEWPVGVNGKEESEICGSRSNEY
jgi:hypothetical protein